VGRDCIPQADFQSASVDRPLVLKLAKVPQTPQISDDILIVLMPRIILALLLATALAQAASDREIAEWAIRWEGRVTVDGSRQPIFDVSQIPAGAFHITGIDLTGSVMLPAELEKLQGLLTLRDLYLPGPVWNPGGGSEDANDVFKALGTLKNLERLYFGWHFSANINVQDKGLVHLAGLTELKDLRCSQCRVTSSTCRRSPSCAVSISATTPQPTQCSKVWRALSNCGA